jgi:hypothetical protein
VWVRDIGSGRGALERRKSLASGPERRSYVSRSESPTFCTDGSKTGSKPGATRTAAPTHIPWITDCFCFLAPSSIEREGARSLLFLLKHCFARQCARSFPLRGSARHENHSPFSSLSHKTRQPPCLVQPRRCRQSWLFLTLWGSLLAGGQTLTVLTLPHVIVDIRRSNGRIASDQTEERVIQLHLTSLASPVGPCRRHVLPPPAGPRDLSASRHE